jgi:molybdopterin converting factor small subunit
MMERVSVRLLAELAAEASTRSLTLNWEEGTTLNRLVHLVTEASPALHRWLLDPSGSVAPSVMIAVNGEVCDPTREGDRLISPGAEIFLFLAMEGGSI